MKYKIAVSAAGVGTAAVLAVMLWRSQPNPDSKEPNNPAADGQSLSREIVPPSSGSIVTVSDVVVQIDGKKYDITELCDAVNGVTGVEEIGDYVMVQGHICPTNAFYGFFHRDTQEWEYTYTGVCLTWDENWEQWENPMESVIYVVPGGGQDAVYDWQENEIAVVGLGEGEYVRELKRAGNDITVSICTAEGGRRDVEL